MLFTEILANKLISFDSSAFRTRFSMEGCSEERVLTGDWNPNLDEQHDITGTGMFILMGPDFFTLQELGVFGDSKGVFRFLSVNSPWYQFLFLIEVFKMYIFLV
jgi:hypothetical protein